jgi:fructoselysine transporter
LCNTRHGSRSDSSLDALARWSHLICFVDFGATVANLLPEDRLERGLGLSEAVALNMNAMVGIGPFIVIPLVIQQMGGPQCLLAWVAGAVLSLLDGQVWAELGAAMPRAGGTYAFLREAYGPGRGGRLMSFLYIWQTLIQAPLVIASGAIGFAQYSTYLVPIGVYGQKAVSAVLVSLLMILLYRRITTVGLISKLLWIGVVGTIVWLIWGGFTHFSPRMAFDFPPGAWSWSWVFFAGLGSATVDTIYTYLGYYHICNLGAEVRQPERNIPRGILYSILGIAVLYLAMQTSILGVIPWREAQHSQYIVSTFVERIYGTRLATYATIMILWIAFASLFTALLSYSRVPFAAAEDGNFFSVFARVHPTKHFPHVSLVFLGVMSLLFSVLFRLETVIRAILAMRLLVQFVGQATGVMLLRRRWPPERLPFKMWFYPLPAVITIFGWLALFVSTGWKFVTGGIVVISLGVVTYMIQARYRRLWPFEAAGEAGQ